MSRADDFFQEIDRRWDLPVSGRVPLRVIGCGALMLQVDAYDRGTKDSDILKTIDLAEGVSDRLLQLAGRDSRIHAAHRMYVELVPNGLPFLAIDPTWRSVASLAALRHFEVRVLDVVDVVVAKLCRLHRDDLADIEAMIDRDLVPHARLLDRFRAALDYAASANPDDLPTCVENLHRVERDILGVDETEIDLPSWI